MGQTPLQLYDGLARDVLAIPTEYRHGARLAPHRHRRAQFLYGIGGIMDVTTEHGSWVVPSDCAVLIPAGSEHAVTMWGVSTRSLYIEPTAAPWFPSKCTVVEVTPLLRELLAEAVKIPLDGPLNARDRSVIALTLNEVEDCGPLPLDLPLPSHQALRNQCQLFLQDPGVHISATWWAAGLNVSERTVARLFRTELSMTVAEWQRRACVMRALRQLAAGVPVSTIAADLRYSSPAAFTTMFRQVMGTPPNTFRSQAR